MEKHSKQKHHRNSLIISSMRLDFTRIHHSLPDVPGRHMDWRQKFLTMNLKNGSRLMTTHLLMVTCKYHWVLWKFIKILSKMGCKTISLWQSDLSLIFTKPSQIHTISEFHAMQLPQPVKVYWSSAAFKMSTLPFLMRVKFTAIIGNLNFEKFRISYRPR